MSVLWSLLAFIVAISILVTVHEFGHFWVARKVGVKVLRFSIGFGKPLWSWRSAKDGTEYAVAAIPLGGYVKMLDEREGPVATEELHRAFNRQSVPKHAAVVVAGPLFNILFAIFAYWVMFSVGVPGVRPMVGEVHSGTPAAVAGIEHGDEIVAVDHRKTPTWSAVLEDLLPYALRKERVAIAVRDEHGRQSERTLDFTALKGEAKPDKLMRTLGMAPYSPPVAPVIGEVVPGSPAQQGGLKSGDRIVSVGGKPVSTWHALVEEIREHPEQRLAFGVRRGGALVTLHIRPKRVEQDGKSIGHIGAGVHIDPAMAARMRADWKLNPLRAVGAAVRKTWNMSTLTLAMLGEMLVGKVSVDNVSGPITIALYAKASANAGFSQFAAFLAIVSISLGVLNLLPVPVLDGGHLLFLVVEAVKGSPVSERVEVMGQKIGLTLIALLMGLALYNDMIRLAG